MKRSDFLKTTILASVSFALDACKKNSSSINNKPCITSTIKKKAIIIGSGYGGSVCALRLSEAGIETLLLERGKRWTTDGTSRVFSNALGTEKESTWLSNESAQPFLPSLPIFNRKYIGVAEKIKHQNLTTVSAACLGGGSIISGGIMMQPEATIFNRFISSEINYAELNSTYFPKVKQEIGIGNFDRNLLNHPNFKHNSIFAEHNDRIGINNVNIQSDYNQTILQEEINGSKKPSTIIGQSVFGCDSGVKNSLDKNYLNKAEQTGNLEIITQCVVDEIAQNCNQNYIVFTKEIDTEGNTINTKTYECEYLFVCAGSIHTSKLFTVAKAKNSISNLNDFTGTQFGNNGNTFVIRDNLSENTGNTQAFPPVFGAQDFSNAQFPLFIEHFPFSFGLELKSLGYNIMSINQSTGFFSFNENTNLVQLNYPALANNQQKQINDLAIQYAKKLNTENGGKLSGFLGAVPKSDVTYHPLGGMPITKATDAYGRVKNNAKLYVQDGALMPGHSACVNPALTIAAIVERNIENILNNDF
jgi:cholesterol oxidase